MDTIYIHSNCNVLPLYFFNENDVILPCYCLDTKIAMQQNCNVDIYEIL